MQLAVVRHIVSASVFALVACVGLSGCGTSRSRTDRGPVSTSGIPSALLAEARPIGRGARFHPPPSGPIAGRCTARLGPRTPVHLEVFAANRVVIVPAGIGVRSPLTSTASRILRARCYGPVVTLEPTGVVLIRGGLRMRLSDVFHAWGQPLTSGRVASFGVRAEATVRVFIDGRLWPGEPGSVPVAPRAEIVVEVGPYVPPHSSFRFPPTP